MTEFKICGLRTLEDALAAADAGASFLGFVFVPGVRRQIDEELASEIIQEVKKHTGSDGPRIVGLFANQPLPDVNRIVGKCNLDFAQLCGDEPPDYWDNVEAWVIKMLKVADDGPKEKLVAGLRKHIEDAVSRMHLCLLDKYTAGALGGTGKSFDWNIAAEIARHYRIILAGGLTPKNVREAMSTAGPWGVDVSTGVETDGVKDIEKIKAFGNTVRAFGAA
ncbi:MAG: hypothetical protein BZY79_05930 [SAR202 cluster bacterium Casp-Chloro-G4]|nr:phosphoribosylanthranilate isomerase [Chloroflexota bacterium]MDA1227603.1 phosphoribosylanthranilate isomerase [Chloroflexota bacterium]PKB60990.1 MAG: hypothetical protein BZY79_05930 [SAR202 cluster bacterium Casp-Chloro-G4]